MTDESRRMRSRPVPLSLAFTYHTASTFATSFGTIHIMTVFDHTFPIGVLDVVSSSRIPQERCILNHGGSVGLDKTTSGYSKLA